MEKVPCKDSCPQWEECKYHYKVKEPTRGIELCPKAVKAFFEIE